MRIVRLIILLSVFYPNSLTRVRRGDVLYHSLPRELLTLSRLRTLAVELAEHYE